jgi:adenine-specific DNA-methyltransferase
MIISSSSGEHGDEITEAVFPFAEIVHPHDAGKFIHIPFTVSHARAKETMDGLSSSLASLGVTVSTGRVVDFRLKDALRKEPEPGTVPLVYPSHFNGGTVHWPQIEGRKPNAIVDNDETRPWLVRSGVYLLTKRFTSKEERRRPHSSARLEPSNGHLPCGNTSPAAKASNMRSPESVTWSACR